LRCCCHVSTVEVKMRSLLLQTVWALFCGSALSVFGFPLLFECIFCLLEN
jgi:hypothetical protein